MTPSYKFFKQVIEQTAILRTPQRRLATFGETRITYFLLSEIKGFKDRCRLRRGIVIAERPKILTPEFLQNRFQGFGREAKEFGRWLADNYGESFKGLEYKFRNEPRSTTTEHSPIKALSEHVEKRLVGNETSMSTILQGPDQAWQISLMKFIVDECMASYKINLRELDEHGFFDTPEKLRQERKKIVEELFRKAREDRSVIPVLDRKLRDFGMFREYEDDFFGLFKS